MNIKASILVLLLCNAFAANVPARDAQSIPLDAATLAALPREAVSATAHGKTHACEGVSLVALLRHAGAIPDGELRGSQLARFVRVGARDGYRVVFSLGELDPATGGRRVVVVDRCDGKPLGDEVGPLRLVVPGDARPARWVRQLETITVSNPWPEPSP